MWDFRRSRKPSSGSSGYVTWDLSVPVVTDNKIHINSAQVSRDLYACRLNSSMATISAENNPQAGHIII